MHLLAREEMGLRCLLRVALSGASTAAGSDALRASPARARSELDAERAANPGERNDSPPVPIAKIAADEGISGVYAAKLMRQLRLAGLVESTRGAAGGYRLSRPAEAISVWDAIHALDDHFLPNANCQCDPADRIDCHRTTSCSVSSLWRSLGNEIRDKLEAVSLATLCAGSGERSDRVDLPILNPARRDADSLKAESSPVRQIQERSPTWSH